MQFLHTYHQRNAIRYWRQLGCSSSGPKLDAHWAKAATFHLRSQAHGCPTLSTSTACPAIAADDDWLQRSRLLVGEDGLARLAATNVLVVGLGGVGGFCAEFLCRAGIGSMTVVDGDAVDPTNRNRQLLALKSTEDMPKAKVLAARLRDINPSVHLTEVQEFLEPTAAADLVTSQSYDYVLDCIDSIAPKQHLILAAVSAGVPVISSMGAGGRMDPSCVRTADISETYNDPFAANIRRGLRKKGVKSGVTVVFSSELAKKTSLALTDQQYKKSYYGTVSYIPALFGLHMAAHVIRRATEPGYKLPRIEKSGGSGLRRKRSSSSATSSSPSRSTFSSSSNSRDESGSGRCAAEESERHANGTVGPSMLFLTSIHMNRICVQGQAVQAGATVSPPAAAAAAAVWMPAANQVVVPGFAVVVPAAAASWGLQAMATKSGCNSLCQLVSAAIYKRHQGWGLDTMAVASDGHFCN